MSNSSERGGGFCDDPLWDISVTWNTDNPDLTTCFHQTVLVYVPAIVLFLFAPIQLSLARRSHDRNVPWSVLNILRMGFTVLLILLPIIDLIYQIKEGVAPVHYVASAVKIVSYSLALYLQLDAKKHGLVTSGILLAFWFLMALGGAVTFRSVLNSGHLSGEDKVLPLITAALQYPIVLATFFLACWADPKPTHISIEDQIDDLTPEKYASAFSKMIFAWLDPLTKRGWKKTLNPSDLWSLLTSNRCSYVVPVWDKYFEKAKEKDAGKGKLSILPVMIRSFGPSYSFSSILMLILSVLQFANPQIVNLLIDFVESDDPDWKGYFYTVLIVMVTFAVTVLNAQSFYREYLVGLRIRTGLISAIYRKSLRLSNTARKEMTVGETTNLMQIDTQKFLDLSLYLNLVWTSPLQIILAMYFLWQILGPSSLAGLAVMILMGPLNAIVARTMKKLQIEQMKNKDRRNKMMDEILNGMKILKLYAWEASFMDKVTKIREMEIKALKRIAYLNAAMTFLWVCAPVIVALASFATFVLIDPRNVLDANTAFVSLTLFNLLRVPLNVLPILIVYIIQCQVSLKRINKFMNSGELDPDAVQHDPNVKEVILVKDATYTWGKNAGLPPTLKNVDVKVKKNQLVAVVGQVGTGKSSLLSAMLGEMDRVSGNINTRGSVAYVPQQAWIQNGTVEYNIHFGKPSDKKRYDKVLEACALVTDLKILPGGDQTEIGEKGINLSGGQKQRISMARAVYNNGDLYLLDDPLSAVDAHVGAHIFENVIGNNGMLKDKTRVLVTHSAKYLPQMDRIFVMKDGTVSEQGDYHELLAAGGEFADFLVQYLTEEKEKDDGGESETDLESLKQTLENVMGKERLEKQMSIALSQHSRSAASRASSRSQARQRKVSRMLSTRSKSVVEEEAASIRSKDSVRLQATSKEDEEAEVVKAGKNLIEEEKAAVGGVKWAVYFYYAKSVGLYMTIGSILLYAGFTGFQVGSSIWLSTWSTDPMASTDIPTRNKYLSVYGVLGLLQSLFIMIATVVLSIGTLNAAMKLHEKMLSGIMRSPMSFFDTTPLGRILNRFSKDIDIADVTIPAMLRGLIGQLLGVIGTVIIICFANPLFIAVIIPLGVVFYFLQKWYITTARQVKRLESISRSPIYSHFGETVSGAPTIRAYDMTKNFIAENEAKIDANQVCYYPTFVSSRWLAVRLETIGNVVILFASLFAVLSRDTMDPGLVGLSLSYALTVTQAMSFLVSMVSEIETNMVGVERIKEYQEIKEEAPLEMPGQDPPPSWPAHGVVKFDNYQTRYREGLDLVLRGIDCDIMSGEKIGIVGRTGAGKSSLTLALFRIIESAGGSIFIDGENIGLMGLQRLRSKLTIIPQDPVLFSGSLRMNLDPFEAYSDDQIWKALEHAHLKSFVSNMAGDGLEFEVNEGGENLSVGQRQLVCLARALLRKTKVLILDEATAAIDLETDDLIQETIRKEFAECTVLTIAHRLNTIMDSSRVMVLDAGKIVEFDSPENLLKNSDSIFYGMASEAGLLQQHHDED